MSERNIRPVPGDPATPRVEAFLDLSADTEWLLTDIGEYHTSAAETMKRDGSAWQRVVLVEWPCHVNHIANSEVMLRLMISPEDAEGLAEVLTHTARWLRAATELGR